MADVVIYHTSVATDWKTKKDTYRIKQLLETKKVPYTEVQPPSECCRLATHLQLTPQLCAG